MLEKPDSRDRKRPFFSAKRISSVSPYYQMSDETTCYNEAFFKAVVSNPGCTLESPESCCISQRPGHTPDQLGQNLGEEVSDTSIFRTPRWIPMCKVESYCSKEMLLNLNTHTNHLWILLKCKFWFRRSGDSGPWTTFEVAWLKDLSNYLAIPMLQYDFAQNESSMIICCIFKWTHKT